MQQECNKPIDCIPLLQKEAHVELSAQPKLGLPSAYKYFSHGKMLRNKLVRLQLQSHELPILFLTPLGLWEFPLSD